MTTHTGGCLCGAISYGLEQDAVVTAMHCHCLDCQKSTGSGKATIIAIPESSLTVKGTLKYYSVVGTDGATVNRGFCENCGSPVMSLVVGLEGWEGIKLIKAGSLDDSSWVTVNASIWKSSARHWDAVREELPTFEHNPQNYQLANRVNIRISGEVGNEEKYKKSVNTRKWILHDSNGGC